MATQRSPMEMFTPEQFSDYQEVKGMMVDLYPNSMKPNNPLPLTDEAINRMKGDPYIRQTDEQLDNFFTIWQMRREYAMNVCIYQMYYCDAGQEQGPIPDNIIANRARQLAMYARSVNFSQKKWIRKDETKITTKRTGKDWVKQ